MFTKTRNTLMGVALALGAASVSALELKASHQWPGGTGDLRDEMVQIIAREAEAANVDLQVRVYPGSSLYKAREQWDAIVKGNLDITAVPLAYFAGRHPEFNITLMPGLVKNHDHALRFNHSPAMQRVKEEINRAGVLVLADTWLAGGFASKKNCILEPDDVKGSMMRAAGKSFEEMLAAAGASISSMPSSEIYTGLQTNVLDAVNTSSESFVSYRIYEQVKCVTGPGEHALWFMYEPILISKRSFDKLSKEQQDVLMAAGKKAEEYAYQAAKEADEKMEQVYRENGVEVARMNAEQAEMWRALARETSYASFAKSVKNGQEMIDQALAVE